MQVVVKFIRYAFKREIIELTVHSEQVSDAQLSIIGPVLLLGGPVRCTSVISIFAKFLFMCLVSLRTTFSFGGLAREI